MIHTIQTAGKATFFTSLTTAAAYAANIFSQVHCSFGIWGFLFLPETLIEREAASTIFCPLLKCMGMLDLLALEGCPLPALRQWTVSLYQHPRQYLLCH